MVYLPQIIQIQAGGQMTSDNRTELLRYILVATCVILYKNKDNKIETLIVKRGNAETEGPGLWAVPGGKIDRSDWGCSRITPEGATFWQDVFERGIKREVFEEIGVGHGCVQFALFGLECGDLFRELFEFAVFFE